MDLFTEFINKNKLGIDEEKITIFSNVPIKRNIMNNNFFTRELIIHCAYEFSHSIEGDYAVLYPSIKKLKKRFRLTSKDLVDFLQKNATTNLMRFGLADLGTIFFFNVATHMIIILDTYNYVNDYQFFQVDVKRFLELLEEFKERDEDDFSDFLINKEIKGYSQKYNLNKFIEFGFLCFE